MRLSCKPAAFAAGLFALASATAAAQGPDMAVMMKWGAVTVIRYEALGEYSGEPIIVNGGTNGYAKVTDRVIVVFDWDQTEAKLVGEPSIRNYPSDMGALRNGADGCRAPTISGKYEHYTLVSLKEGLAGQLTATQRTEFPAGAVPVACTGGDDPVAARTVETQEDFVVPGVMLLAMKGELGGDVSLSPDGNSIIQKNKGWTWTYTPRPKGENEPDLEDLQLEQ